MHRLKISAPLFLAALTLTGCATSALDMAPPRPDAPWPPSASATTTPPTGGGYVLPPNPALAATPPPPPIDPNRAYALAGLIDIAESNNPQTRIAWDAARQAALAAGIAESLYLPNITASALGAYQDDSSHQSLAGFSGNGNNQAHGVISAISLNWLLFDFGERSAVITAAKQGSVISNIAFTQAHQLVIYNVSLAYYAYAAARARDVSAKQSLSNAQDVLAAAQARQLHGIGTVVDTAQAGQAVAQAKFAVVQADGGVQDAYLALLNAMGISPLTQMKIADLAPRTLSPALDTPVQTIVAQALAQRPDMQSAFAAQQQSLANIKAAQAEFMPKVFVSATGSYNSGALDVTSVPGVGQQAATGNLSGNHLGGIIMAGITVPLYDGGTRAAVLAQARASADSANAALALARDEATRQVVDSQNKLATSLAGYSAAQALVAAAQTSYDAALAAYRNGVGSVTDATLAQTQLLQARNTQSDAYSAALSAAATLAFTTGALGAAPP